jgi:hypothetical protein
MVIGKGAVYMREVIIEQWVYPTMSPTLDPVDRFHRFIYWESIMSQFFEADSLMIKRNKNF